MTERHAARDRHPYVDIMGHPTGRMLLRREPYESISMRCSKRPRGCGVAFEINSQIYRLDLYDVHARLAKRARREAGDLERRPLAARARRAALGRRRWRAAPGSNPPTC